APLLPETSSYAPKVEVLYSCASNPGIVQLVCFISGFYPDHITVEWTVEGKLLPSETDTPTKDGNGRTFSTRSTTSVSQSEWLQGKTYTCQVSHPGTGTIKQDHAHKCEGDGRK
uniref:Ig-like domain-containing protein n=1 Tax=Chelydra serpentina TaxID=8475 RepID=A0A8C3XP08_CHESE